MSKLFRVLLLLGLCITVSGPAWAMPVLSAHSPTVSAPAPAPPAPWSHALPFLFGPIAGLTVKADAGTVATKWAARAANAQGDYSTGVANASGKWQQQTAAAEPAYEQGVQAAIAKKRFGAGVTAAAAAKFQRNATTNGPQRYATGVQGGAGSYQTGVAPYLDVLRNFAPPVPRGPKGSPANMQIANAVAMALHAKKVGS